MIIAVIAVPDWIGAIMLDLVSRGEVLDALIEKGQKSKRYKWGESWELNLTEIKEAVESVPSVYSEIITIEEVSKQLGYTTIQSALYWFEFLKTLDSLGFAIVRKKTK